MLEKYFIHNDAFDIPLPISNSKMAAFILKKNLAHYVYNTLTLLENNPSTLPQTELILEGYSVQGLSIDDLLQVKHFGDAAKSIIQKIETNSFNESLDTLREIHSLVAKEKALEWGIFRKHQVHIGGCEYIPPSPNEINEILEKGISEINQINNALERGIKAFAFFSKTQPFYDGNKRTAILYMNGVLLKNGFYPLFVPINLKNELNISIHQLYDNNLILPLVETFKKSCEVLWPEKIDYGERYNSKKIKKEKKPKISSK